MTLGIGGAGSKLSSLLDPRNVIINVSQTELDKVRAAEKLLAVLHSERGQRRGCRKNPELGMEAFTSIRNRLLDLIRGDLVIASAGGGTGNGICTRLLGELAAQPSVPEDERTAFAFLVPYAERESAEYVNNAIAFLTGPVSRAVDSGNTGNIFLSTSRGKFVRRISEPQFNEELVASLRGFLEIPARGAALPLIEGHIDYEDFDQYLAKPFFNYFTAFELEQSGGFAAQLEAHRNPFLLPPDTPIEALFFLEVPPGGDATLCYEVLDHLASFNVSPVFSVAENPERSRPFITVSLLYSRKPELLLTDLQRVAQTREEEKIRKSIEQQVTLRHRPLNVEEEARKAGKKAGKSEEDVLSVLRRLGKLR